MALTSARLRAVNAVYETGSFSAAARRLGVSQPAVAQQVRDLERAFGVALFHRQGQGLMATGLCQQLYGATLRMQEMESDALRILSQHATLSEGVLRCGLGNSMPGMKLIASFQQLYPGIQVQVETGSWSNVIEAVVDRRVDVAMLPEVPNDGRFRRQACLNQGVVAVAPPGHPLAQAASASCRELMRHRLVFRTRASSTQRVVNRAFAADGLSPKPALIADSRDAVFEAVANGLGVGFMWEHGSSRGERLVKVRVPAMAEPVPEYIFCLAGQKDRLVDLFFQASGLAGLSA